MSNKITNGILQSMIVVLLSLTTTNLFSQVPSPGIFFQAVARDNFANPAKDRKIYVQSSVVQSTATGTKVLTEEFQTMTDATGVFSISIGQGTRVGGTVANLASIDWASGPYFLNLKVSITPTAPIVGWDYKSEWVDLGTTSFGAVPYALFAGTATGLEGKLNSKDTASMLSIYAKAQAVKTLETTVGTKVASTDTAAMLAPYKKMVNEIIASNITSLTADAINSALDSKVNLVDSNLVYVTPAQLAAKSFDSSAIYNQLALKSNTADVTTSLATKVDKVTGKELSSNDYTNAEKTKLAAITGTNTGDQDLSAYARTANVTTLLALKANITDVSSSLSSKENIANKVTSNDLGGSNPSDEFYPTQKAVKEYVDASVVSGAPDATTVLKGKIVLAGDLTGNASNPTIANNAVTTIKIADLSVTDAKINTVAGSKVIGNISGNATNVTGTVAVANGGTGAANAIDARANLGLVIGTDVLAQRNFGTAANSNIADFEAPLTYTSPLVRNANTISITPASASVDGYLTAANWTNFNGKIDAAEKAAVNGVATLDGSGKIPSIQIPAITFSSVDVVTSDAEMLALTGKLVGAIAIRTDVNKNYVLKAADASLLSNWIQLVNPTTVQVVNTKTGANITLTADDITGGVTNKYFSNSLARAAVSATAPLAYDATNGVFSMAAASTNGDGYLTATDWNTFNAKQGAFGTQTANTFYAAPSGASGVPSFRVLAVADVPTLNQNTTGNAATATKLATPKNINGTAFDGSADITIATAAGTLSGSTLASNVTSSSLTSVGIITTGTWNGTEIAIANGGTGATTASGARTNLGLVIGTDVLAPNVAITAASKTKITYDANGLVTAGTDATTADIAPSTNRNYVTDVQAGVLSNTSGTNTGDQTITLIGDVTGTGTGTFTSTLANTGVTSGSYGSTTAIPTFTVDTKGRLTSAGTVGITAGVSSLTYSATSSYADGGNINGTTLTLSPASISNPGLVSTSAQSFTGAKSFNNQVTVPNIVMNNGTAAWELGGGVGSRSITLYQGGCCGRLTMDDNGRLAIGANYAPTTYQFDVEGNGRFTQALTAPEFIGGLTGNATTATIAGNITATANTTLTSLSNLGTVGTITSGTWSASTIDVAHGGTGAINAAAARTNLGLVIGTDVQAPLVAGTDYLSPSGSAATLTNFPTLNQNTTGNAATATKLAATKNINGVAFDGSADITIVADANTLTGTSLASNITSSSITGVGTITSGTWNGETIALANGGTGATSAAAARTNLGLGTAATSSIADFSAPLTFSAPLARAINTISLPAASSSVDGYLSSTDWSTFNNKIDASQKAAVNGVASLGADGKIPSAQIPAISFSTVDVVADNAAMLALTGKVAGAIAVNTGTSKNYVLNNQASPSNLASWTELATPASISSVNGKSGSSVSLVTNDIAEGTTNKYFSNTLARNAISVAAPLAYDAGTGIVSLGTLPTTNGGTGLTSVGTNGQILTSNGTNLVWSNPSTSIGAATNATNLSGGATGSLPYQTAANTTGFLAAGTDGQVLKLSGGLPTWAAAPATGMTSLNGSTSSIQTFATPGSTGTAPAWSTASGAHTLNLPMASATGVTAGLLSKADYDVFNAKQGALTAGSGISIASGTISATGLTTNNLSASAGITNTQLANNSITIGTTLIALGASSTTLAGLTSVTSTGFTGALTGNASTATALSTGRTIALTGDVTYTSGSFDGSANVTGVATLANSGVSSGTYGSSTAIPSITIDSKGRITSATTTSIIAGVNTVASIAGTSNAAGATISGTSITLTPADGSNGGVVTNGAQTFAGAKTFSNNTASTSTSTGAVIVTGGIGIGGAIYGGSIQNTPIGSTTASTGAFTTLTTSGATTVGGTLAVTGAGTFSSTLTAGATTLASATITGNETVGGTLGVTGAGTFSSTLSAGATTLASATITGNETVGGTLAVTGAGTFSSTLSAGATTLASATITGNEIVGGTLGVTGATTLTSLTTTGAATFSSTVKIPTGAGDSKILTSDASGNATWSYSAGATSTKTAAYTITLADKYVFYGSAATGVATFTLPLANGNAGKEIIIKNKSAYTLTVQRAGSSETIFQDNANAAVTSIALGIEASNNWVKLVSDGTQWVVFRALF